MKRADGSRPSPTLQSRILHQQGCTAWIILIGVIAAVLVALFGG